VSKYIEILNLIRVIRESFPQSVEVYTQGSCFRFALILKTVYPEGEIYNDEDHATFFYLGKHFDIRGEVKNPDKNSIPLKEYGKELEDDRMSLMYDGKIAG
jgi:hypothetical protein